MFGKGPSCSSPSSSLLSLRAEGNTGGEHGRNNPVGGRRITASIKSDLFSFMVAAALGASTGLPRFARNDRCDDAGGLREVVARAALLLTLVFGAVPAAQAAPWDIDMYRQPSYKAGEMSRSPVKGSVPVGGIPFSMTTDEADKTLKNPVPADERSLWRGQRYWSMNCAVCHGAGADGQTYVGRQMAAPSLLDRVYRDRTDGRIYGIIYNGGVNMPRYGYKFSAQQIWDVVNYLRQLQSKAVPAQVK